MNMIFVLLCGISMLVFLVINISFRSFFVRLISNSKLRVFIMFGMNVMVLFLVKNDLNNRYALDFTYSWLVVCVELAFLLVIPYIVSRFLKQFSKAFAHL